MFDAIEVRNDNQDMALMVIIEGFKKHSGYNILFNNDMTNESKDLFLNKVFSQVSQIKNR
jgi:hypothetical protein